jgi:hypothetical protein
VKQPRSTLTKYFLSKALTKIQASNEIVYEILFNQQSCKGSTRCVILNNKQPPPDVFTDQYNWVGNTAALTLLYSGWNETELRNEPRPNESYGTCLRDQGCVLLYL